jgi:hypothetical protein
MTDPSDGLKSFQQELRRGTIKVQRATSDSELFVHSDSPLGVLRYTYVRLKNKTVTALVMFAMEPPIRKKPCFSVGYAVPKAYRNQGRAKDVIKAGIADMQEGLKRNGYPEFYLIAIVGADNPSSMRVAEQVISDKPKAIRERISGQPAFRYFCRTK